MKKSFTLIELSVVASLLAAGLAMLLPSLRSIRQQDRLAGCLANLRAIGAASLAYAADDPSEFLIPVPNLSVLPDAPGEFEWGGKSGAGEQSQPGRIESSMWGTAAWRGPAHRPLNRLLYRGEFTDWNPAEGTPQPGAGYVNYINDARLDLDVYRCPADSGYAGGGFLYTGGRHRDPSEQPFRDEGRTAYDHFGTSYAARMFYTSGCVGGSLLRSQSVYLSPLSALSNPGRTIAYQEVPARYIWLWGDWSDPSCVFTNRQLFCVGNFNTVPGWHGRSFNFNVAFADGRAATVEMQGCMRPPPNLGPPSYYPPAGCGEPAYQCHRCVTVRGPGWQIDTLPAPSVRPPWTVRSGPAAQEQGSFLDH